MNQSLIIISKAAQSAKGTALLCSNDVEDLLEYLDDKITEFQSVEAYECRGEKEVLRIDYSILGLDKKPHDECCGDVEWSRRLLSKILAAAKEEANPIKFQIWTKTHKT